VLPLAGALVVVVLLGGGAFAWLRLQSAGGSTPSAPPPTALARSGVASSAAAPLASVPANSQAPASVLAPDSTTPQVSAIWQAEAPLAQARWGQGSATLADGRVLVVGGTTTTTSVGALASAELFDPASDTWQILAPMHEARAYPVVVPLEDGRILVAGGARDKAPLASSEIYDPGSGSWSPGPSMTTRRSVFAGVRLADGRVLVVGGGTTASAGPATRSAEIFDPAADRWTATAPMHAARAYPTATLLPDGRVLVVGGATTYAENGTVLGTAELFDPSHGTWSETGPLVVPVYGHAANLLPNGDVLVTGGWSSTAASAPAIATAQPFDPRSNSWTATTPMQVARADARTLVFPDGQVLVVGGLSADYTALASVELYDPAGASWATLPSTVVAEWWGTLALLPSGNVLLAGGSADSAGSAPLRDAEVLQLNGTAP
jgi:N-acetylneuraminic acid mutarotase